MKMSLSAWLISPRFYLWPEGSLMVRYNTNDTQSFLIAFSPPDFYLPKDKEWFAAPDLRPQDPHRRPQLMLRGMPMTVTEEHVRGFLGPHSDHVVDIKPTKNPGEWSVVMAAQGQMVDHLSLPMGLTRLWLAMRLWNTLLLTRSPHSH